jgi:ABC-type amino acid transport substrate-binding protein
MRGRRRTVASVLAETLARRSESRTAALAAALAEACGPRLARETSFRGVTRDGLLLVLVRTEAWADQIRALEPELCRAVNARLRQQVAVGLDVRIEEAPSQRTVRGPRPPRGGGRPP